MRHKQRAEEGFTAPTPSMSSPGCMCEFLWYFHLKEEERAEGRQRGEGERGEPKERQPGGSYSLFIYYFPLISLKALRLTCPSQRSQAALCLSKAHRGSKLLFHGQGQPSIVCKTQPPRLTAPLGPTAVAAAQEMAINADTSFRIWTCFSLSPAWEGEYCRDVAPHPLCAASLQEGAGEGNAGLPRRPHCAPQSLSRLLRAWPDQPTSTTSAGDGMCAGPGRQLPTEAQGAPRL